MELLRLLASDAALAEAPALRPDWLESCMMRAASDALCPVAICAIVIIISLSSLLADVGVVGEVGE